MASKKRKRMTQGTIDDQIVAKIMALKGLSEAQAWIYHRNYLETHNAA